MEYLVLLGLVIFIFIMLRVVTKTEVEDKKAKLKKAADAAQKKAESRGLLVQCPLCSSSLLPGEDLFSVVYRHVEVGDQLCIINGCPHCFPMPESGVHRVCPVCGKDVPLKDGHLIARLFNYKDGHKHVAVTGCNRCSESGSRKGNC